MSTQSYADAPQASATQSTGEWRDMIDSWRRSQVIDEQQESALFRYFTEREIASRADMDAIAKEYASRQATAGDGAAKEWLTGAAERMARRDREELDQLLASLQIKPLS